MQISAVKSSNNVALKKSNTLSKGNIQSNNQISFSAYRSSSGEYSNWCVKIVKERMNLSVAAFKESIDNFFSKEFVCFKEDFVNIGKKDCLSLRNDLDKGESLVNLGRKDYDLGTLHTSKRQQDYSDSQVSDFTEEYDEEEARLNELRGRYPDEFFP